MTLKDILKNAEIEDQKSGKELKVASDFDEYSKKLIDKAKEKVGEITPSGTAKNFTDSITSQGKELWLWYNDKNQNTHIASVKVESRLKRFLHETA